MRFARQMRTLLGWKDAGEYGSRHGLQESKSYFEPLEATFRSYEKAFPSASAAQGFRFMIAQAYWKAKNWGKTREWLNKVVARDGNANSFFKDLAERRLTKVEY